VVHPWACLNESGPHNTVVLYLDSTHDGVPLATPEMFAKVVVEWDAIRQGQAPTDAVDGGFVEAVQSRVTFCALDVSQLCDRRIQRLRCRCAVAW
jgi:hypothetical protein